MSDGTYNGRKPRPFVSKEDMLAHLLDKRYRGGIYEADPSFQEYVKACLMLSEDETVGANGRELTEAVAEPKRQDWQDPQGDLDKDVSVYHTIAEQQADARNPRYRTDPYFREQVARKIARSTPDWEPRTGKEFASLQVEGNEEESERQ
jgi:hypothetical protein